MRVTSTGRIKICEFGFARAAAPQSTGAITSAPSAGERSDAAYLAPEQVLENTEKPAPATDVYAFGGVAAFMISGVEPWASAPTIPSIIKGLSKRDQVSSLNSSVPESVRNEAFGPSVWLEQSQPLLELIGQCLSIQPEARPTMEDVANRLRGVVRGLGASIADPVHPALKAATKPVSGLSQALPPSHPPLHDRKSSEIIKLDDIKFTSVGM